VNLLIAYPNSGKHWIRAILRELQVPHKSSQQGNYHNQTTNLPIEQIEKYVTTYQYKFNDMQVLLLHRDVRDTAVSNYWHLTARPEFKYSATISDFLRDPLNGVEKNIRFNLLMKSVLKNNFIDITYEQMHTDPVTVIQRVIQHFKCDKTVEQIKTAITNNTFDKMKQAEIAQKNQINAEAYKTRRGVVGGYKDYLSVEDIAYCDKLLAKYDYYKIMGAA
jgi:hypothetical protein